MLLSKDSHDDTTVLTYVCAILVPLFGFILAVISFHRGIIGEGLAFVLTGVLAMGGWAIIFWLVVLAALN